MLKKKSVTFSAGVWHDRDPDEARVLKMHLGHKVSIQSVYKSFANARYLDAVLLECQDCCEVLLWYQEADDVDASLISDTKNKVAKSAYDADESEYVLDHADAILNQDSKARRLPITDARGVRKADDVVTRRGYLRN